MIEKVKSKEFMEYFYDFINHFNKYFEQEAKKYIEELKDNKNIKKSTDPKINKESWTTDEDLIVIYFIKDYLTIHIIRI